MLDDGLLPSEDLPEGVARRVVRAVAMVPSPRGKPLSDMTLSKLTQGTRPSRGAAWVPVELPGLGGGADEHAARSGRGRVGPYGAQPDGGGLRPVGPVRAPAPPDGQLGLCHRYEVTHSI